MSRITAAEQTGRHRRCRFGQSPDRSYFVELPTGYPEVAAEVGAKCPTVRVREADWIEVVSPRPTIEEAREAFQNWLAANGHRDEDIAPDRVELQRLKDLSVIQ